MLTRSIPPQIVLPSKIEVPRAKEIKLRNGTPLLLVNSGSDPVCRMDIILNSGSRYQLQNLVATATISMLSEGSKRYTSQQIAEHFDFHGSFIDLSADRDWGKVTLYCLKKYFKQSIEMLSEIIKNPIFPEKELLIWSSRSKQTLMVELDKTSTLARQMFFLSLFGGNHPYGRFAKPEDYDLLAQNQLQQFHKKFFGGVNAQIVLSGHIEENEVALVEQSFGNENWGSATFVTPNGMEISTSNFGISFVEKKDAVQSAIRVGCELFKRNHPDYPKMLILNTVLGGYFGSRLMKNLREEKGYTYGIGSYIVALRDSGFLTISTEVGATFTKSAVDEILKEIEKLKTKPIELNELEQVKSFMLGEALRSFNGPFAIADNIISLLNFNQLDYDFYNRLFDTIRAISPDELISVARKWLPNEKFIISVAGSVNPNI